MKIAVLLKCVPDTEANIKISQDSQTLDFSSVKFIINPYDEIALEEALKIKDKDSSTYVKVFSACNIDLTKDVIIKALAMGADDACVINNTQNFNLNSLSIAHVLAQEIKNFEPDIIFCGKTSIDNNNSHIPNMLSHILNLNHLGPISKFTLEKDHAIVEKTSEDGSLETYKISFPCILSCDRMLNQPRYAPITGILKAKKKPINIKNIEEYTLDFSNLQDITSINFEYPSLKKQLHIISGANVEEKILKLYTILKEKINQN